MKLPLLLVLAATPALAAPLRAVRDTGLEGICAVTDAGAIVCEQADALPSADIPARDFAPAYNPVVVRSDGSLVRTRRTSAPPIAIAAPFRARSAGIVGSAKHAQLCVVSEKGELACGSFEHGSADAKIAFTMLKGRYVDVRFDNEAVWALDDKGALWCSGSAHCARAHIASKKTAASSVLDLAATWPSESTDPDDAPFFRVSTGVKRMYVGGAPCIELVADPKSLVCWSDQAPATYPRPKGDEIASIGMWTCARSGASITCAALGNPYVKPFTANVPGAVKMHNANRKLCIETAKAELRCAALGPPLNPFETLVWATRQATKNDP